MSTCKKVGRRYIHERLINEVIDEYHLNDIDPDRLDVCVAGVQLTAVRKKEDVLYILRDAKDAAAASRRLKDLVARLFED